MTVLCPCLICAILNEQRIITTASNVLLWNFVGLCAKIALNNDGMMLKNSSGSLPRYGSHMQDNAILFLT